MCLFVDFPLNKNKADCYLSKTINFEYWANFIFCIFNTWVHITRFVKLPNPNKDTMLRQALQWKRDGVRHCIKSRQDISSLYRQRNRGRRKLLQRNSAAAMSSARNSSDVRRPFRVSARQRAVISSEVNRGVRAAYGAKLHRTVCMAP